MSLSKTNTQLQIKGASHDNFKIIYVYEIWYTCNTLFKLYYTVLKEQKGNSVDPDEAAH